MRPALLACLVLVLALALPRVAAGEGPLERLYRPTPGEVLIVPHRGDWRNAPENSLRAVRNAIELGAVVVEIDVRRTRDGHYVLLHDKTLDRTTTGTGDVADHMLDELRPLRLRNGYGLETDEPIPTLPEALGVAAGRALLYLDKTEHDIADAARYVDGLDALDRVVFYGRSRLAELRREVGGLLPRLHYMPKVGDGTADPHRYVRDFLDAEDARVPGFILDFRAEDAEVLGTVPTIKAAGKRVWMSPLWPGLAAGRTDDRAVDDPDAHWGWLIARGADMLCTDRPAELAAYLHGRHTAAAEAPR